MSRKWFTVALLSLTAGCSAPVDEQASSQSEGAAPAAASDVAPVAADGNDVEADAKAAACPAPTGKALSSDPGYRVVIYPTADNGSVHPMPSPTTSWQIKYEYTVPPLPCSPTFYDNSDTFYVWGDIDFDAYGSFGGSNSISSYMYNQIVPQLMVGYGLDSNDAAFTPSWHEHDGWVIQAQYYWRDGNNVSYAQAGQAVGVSVGDVVTTVIKYTATSGSIAVTISTPKVSSSITLARPFPNQPALFSSWKSFFQQAAAKSGTLWGRPQMNVESHGADTTAMCSVLPWNVELFSVPNTTAKGTNFTTVEYANGVNSNTAFTCPKGKYATLSF